MAYHCIKHPAEPAVASCAYCGQGICADCVQSSVYHVGIRSLCPDCNVRVALTEVRRIGRLRMLLGLKSLLIVIGFVVCAVMAHRADEPGGVVLGWLLAGVLSAFSAFGSRSSTVDHIFRGSVLDADRSVGPSRSVTYVRALLSVVLGPLAGLGWLVTNVFTLLRSREPLRQARSVSDRWRTK